MERRCRNTIIIIISAYPKGAAEVGRPRGRLQRLQGEDHLPLVRVRVEPELGVGQRGVGENAELHVVRTHHEVVDELLSEGDLSDEVVAAALSGGVQHQQDVGSFGAGAGCQGERGGRGRKEMRRRRKKERKVGGKKERKKEGKE